MQHFLTIAVSAVTIAEIVQGVEALPPGKRRNRLEAALEELIADYEVVPFGVPEARE